MNEIFRSQHDSEIAFQNFYEMVFDRAGWRELFNVLMFILFKSVYT